MCKIWRGHQRISTIAEWNFAIGRKNHLMTDRGHSRVSETAWLNELVNLQANGHGCLKPGGFLAAASDVPPIICNSPCPLWYKIA